MKKTIEKVRKKRWRALLTAGAVILLSAVGVFAFQEVSVIYRAVSGKVAVHMEEYMMKDGEEMEWMDGQAVMPGGSISKIPRIYNDGEPCYVRAQVEFDCDSETSVPLSADNLEGISDQWIRCGDYFYYSEVLGEGESVDFFKKIKVPEQWESGIDDGKNWKARVRVDAVQADFFHPDFASDDPWKMSSRGYQIQKAVDEEPENQQKDEEPVSLEVDAQMKGFQTDTREFFRELETFVPGKSQTGMVTITNRTGKEREVFIRSEILEENEFVEVLELTVQVRDKDRIQIIYQGILNAEELKEYRSIGKIPENSTENVEFLIHMPEEADNRYSVKQGKVKFTFTTDIPDQAAKSSPVKTGDETSGWIYLGVVLMLPCTAGVILLGTKRKTERKREDGRKMS